MAAAPSTAPTASDSAGSRQGRSDDALPIRMVGLRLARRRGCRRRQDFERLGRSASAGRVRQSATSRRCRHGPAPGDHNFHRGVPLIERDRDVREAIPTPPGWVDKRRVEAEWEAALSAPAWGGSPVWIHGDLLPFNLLVHEAELTAVIDFGGLGVATRRPTCCPPGVASRASHASVFAKRWMSTTPPGCVDAAGHSSSR